MIKKLFLSFAVFAVLFAQAKTEQEKSYPYENEILQFEKMDRDSMPPANAVLFVGSSSIRIWKTLAEDMAPIPVINRGFGGSQAHQVLHYIHRIVFPYKPQAIVFYEGDNDIAAGKSPSQFIEECGVFMDSVYHRLPGVPVFFLSPKPSYARIKLEPVRNEACELLQKFCASAKDAEYIDVSTVMFDSEGTLKKDIFLDDQLHMNAKGYVLWTKIIKKRLTDFLDKADSK